MTVRQAYIDEVRRCSIYLGILARRYGMLQTSGYSATQERVRRSASREERDPSLPGLRYFPSRARGHLNSWIGELYQFHTVAMYAGSDELERQIRTSITSLAGRQITPWVKLDRLVFQLFALRRLLANRTLW